MLDGQHYADETNKHETDNHSNELNFRGSWLSAGCILRLFGYDIGSVSNVFSSR